MLGLSLAQLSPSLLPSSVQSQLSWTELALISAYTAARQFATNPATRPKIWLIWITAFKEYIPAVYGIYCYKFELIWQQAGAELGQAQYKIG